MFLTFMFAVEGERVKAGGGLIDREKEGGGEEAGPSERVIIYETDARKDGKGR